MSSPTDEATRHVLEVIRRNVCVVVPDLDPTLVEPHRSLTDLGCNSIDRADVAAMSMDELGVSVGVAEFADVRDIGTLAAVLRRHLP